MAKKFLTRGETVAEWIEEHCRVPFGPATGRQVRLTPTQLDVIGRIYDQPNDIPVNDRELAAYLALACLASPEAVGDNTFTPSLDVDGFTVWAAADSPSLRDVLKRDGEAIVCPALGKRYPWAA
jgi:hypothetical protein